MKKKKTINPFKINQAYWNKDETILNAIKKEKAILYGMQSIKKRTGLQSRPTQDYDVFHNRPLQFAKKVERKLDRQAGNNNAFFTKPALHPNTFRVMFFGNDGIQNTKDDINLLDTTITPKPMPKYNVINGVRYRALQEERDAKARAIKDPAYSFRKDKDTFDLQDIKNYEKKKKDKLLRNFLMK